MGFYEFRKRWSFNPSAPELNVGNDLQSMTI